MFWDVFWNLQLRIHQLQVRLVQPRHTLWSGFSVFVTDCKNQIVVKNLGIVAQWWTSSEGHLLRLYFGVFQPSVVSSNMLNAVAQRPYEHSPWQCLRGCQGFHVTWIMVMNIHISTTGSSTSTCDRRAVEQPVCEDDKIYVQHQLCVSGRQALCASRSLMTGLHCGTIVHIIGDEQRTYLVVKGTDRNRALRLSRANGWQGDSEILMLCNSRISVLIRIKEELHSTRLYYVQACRVLGSNLPILFGFQDHLRIEIKSNTSCPTTNVFSCYSSRWLL